MINVTIDVSRCQGYGNCLSADPDVFDIDDDGQAFLLTEEFSTDRLGSLRTAASVCPVSAILVETSEGKPPG